MLYRILISKNNEWRSFGDWLYDDKSEAISIMNKLRQMSIESKLGFSEEESDKTRFALQNE